MQVQTCLSTSPDGIHFMPANNGTPVTGRAADTYSQLVWDTSASRYLLYTRTDFGTDGEDLGEGEG